MKGCYAREPMHTYEYEVVISGSHVLRRIFNIEDSRRLFVVRHCTFAVNALLSLSKVKS